MAFCQCMNRISILLICVLISACSSKEEPLLWMVNGKGFAMGDFSEKEKKSWESGDKNQRYDMMLEKIDEFLIDDKVKRLGVSKANLLEDFQPQRSLLAKLPMHKREILNTAKNNYYRILRQNANIQVYWYTKPETQKQNLDRPWLGNESSQFHFVARFSPTDPNFKKYIESLRRLRSVYGGHIKIFWQSNIHDQKSFEVTKNLYCHYKKGEFWRSLKNRSSSKSCSGVESWLEKDLVPATKNRSHIRFPSGEEFSLDFVVSLEKSLEKFLILNSVYR